MLTAPLIVLPVRWFSQRMFSVFPIQIDSIKSVLDQKMKNGLRKFFPFDFIRPDVGTWIDFAADGYQDFEVRIPLFQADNIFVTSCKQIWIDF